MIWLLPHGQIEAKGALSLRRAGAGRQHQAQLRLGGRGRRQPRQGDERGGGAVRGREREGFLAGGGWGGARGVRQNMAPPQTNELPSGFLLCHHSKREPLKTNTRIFM